MSKVSNLNELLLDNKNKKGWPWVASVEDKKDYNKNKIIWPKITIITPSYNQGQYIEETIRSVLLQGYPNLQYIVIDGGSEDCTIDILKKYSKWIDYIVSEPDDGQSDAINKGWSLATGDWTNWINSDDIMPPNTLFDVGHIASKVSKNTLIVGDVLNFNSNERKIINQQNINYDDFIRFWSPKCIWHQPGIFISLEIIKKIGDLDKRLHFAMDYDLLCRLLKVCDVYYSENIYSYFRLHSDAKGISEPRKTLQEKISIFVKYWDLSERKKPYDFIYLRVWLLKYVLSVFKNKSLYEALGVLADVKPLLRRL
jgi:glycosyltransferase involved in cell wall biosynthesis